MNPRYLVIEGPIGVGKSSLASLLSARLGGRLVLEKVEENPFLPKFYENPRRFAFQAQVFFLLSRYSSAVNVLTNTAGAFVGAIFARRWRGL